MKVFNVAGVDWKTKRKFVKIIKLIGEIKGCLAPIQIGDTKALVKEMKGVSVVTLINV